MNSRGAAGPGAGTTWKLVALFFGRQIEHLFDHTGPIGAWMARQNDRTSSSSIPELQAFVSQSVNRPYLELATIQHVH